MARVQREERDRPRPGPRRFIDGNFLAALGKIGRYERLFNYPLLSDFLVPDGRQPSLNAFRRREIRELVSLVNLGPLMPRRAVSALRRLR